MRSLQSRVELCFCPITMIITATMTTPTKICSFAHWQRPFLFQLRITFSLLLCIAYNELDIIEMYNITNIASLMFQLRIFTVSLLGFSTTSTLRVNTHFQYPIVYKLGSFFYWNTSRAQFLYWTLLSYSPIMVKDRTY